MQPTIKMIISDLDGTLLNSNGKISETNLKTLKLLENKNVIRVFATGRSLFSCRKAIDKNTPHDYLAFTTGAGILKNSTNKLLYAQNIEKQDVIKVVEILKNENVNFIITEKIPENHNFYYHKKYDEEDFLMRIKNYENFAQTIDFENINTAAQLIVILKQNQEKDFENLSEKILNRIKNVNIIKSTSPQNGKNIWLEIYPKNITKRFAVEYIAKIHKIDKKEILGIGNDYNDIDFLDFCGTSYVTANAPDSLKKKYKVTDSNDNDGFSKVINKYFNFFENL